MELLNENESILLIIDIQEKLLNAAFNKDFLEKQSSAITKAAAEMGIPIIITEQYPKGLGQTINNIKDNNSKNIRYFEKTTFSALDIPELETYLKELNRKQILLCGIESHICVSQTAYALIQQGYDVSIIEDICGSRTEKNHNAGIKRMQEFGAHILTTEITLFEWLRSAKHPKFKEIQQLIK